MESIIALEVALTLFMAYLSLTLFIEDLREYKLLKKIGAKAKMKFHVLPLVLVVLPILLILLTLSVIQLKGGS